jgi:hypothetical protein
MMIIVKSTIQTAALPAARGVLQDRNSITNDRVVAYSNRGNSYRAKREYARAIIYQLNWKAPPWWLDGLHPSMSAIADSEAGSAT